MTPDPVMLNRSSLTDAPGDVRVDGVYRALADPLGDRLLSLLLHLATELWTVRDRLRLVEGALEQAGIDIETVIDAARQSDDYVDAMRSDRDAFIARVLAPVSPARGRDSTSGSD